MALGVSNNKESFWALQAAGLGVIKEEESRHWQGCGLKGKGLNLRLKHLPSQLQREGGKGKSPI